MSISKGFRRNIPEKWWCKEFILPMEKGWRKQADDIFKLPEKAD
jgi:hypothetical protein